MNLRTLILISSLSIWQLAKVQAQNYVMNGTPVTDCSGTFFDPGGETGGYGNNQNLTTTICSDGSDGTHIRLSFSGADLAPGDLLCLYDGTDVSAPLIACHTDYNPGQPFLIQATAVNPSGCLTVSFVSDGTGTGQGWAAAIACVASCQSVLADLVSTNPAAAPADTGWIDICPGERVFFNGTGVYPQNNFAYAQSDQTTTFEWNFGDGGIAYGPNTSHRFDKPGGYYAQLFLTDTKGCKSTNLINQRIRVAPRPDFQLNSQLEQTICAGDTIHLSATTSGQSGTLLSVIPVTSSFQVEGSRADSLALPDGTGIPYETSIFFSEFSPGQVMTSASDLESICADMEHSWARDVEISLTCPNGQSIILHDHPGNIGGEVYLGEPNDNDNIFPIPGLGYTYCWTNNAPNPTWIEYANTTLGGSGTLPAGDYSPYDPFSDLIGCPLNGEWTITVTDLWPIDNGFIFNWSLKFKDELYPGIEQFTPGLVNWSWNNHPSVFLFSADSISAAPQNAGTAGYKFTVNDAFGCTWDTLLTVAVLPPTHPDCHSCGPVSDVIPDTTVCSGIPVVINAAALAPPGQEVRFEAYPEYRFGNGNHPHTNPYLSPINVNSLGYSLITLPAVQITSVCMDIETDFDADLNIFLQAPSGQLLELSTGNGGSGDNYKITCFTPTATTPIVGQAAPFNGTYKPEGNWIAVQGAGVNGNWALRVSDGFAPNQFGTVKWWSIGFNVNNNVTYSWGGGPGLSCNNCAAPVATPATTTTYHVQANNAFGCQYNDTMTVAVATFFDAPTGLALQSQSMGSMTWSWNPVAGASSYEVSVDGGVWQPASGGTSHTVSGLAGGQMVQLDVRAVSPGCTSLISNIISTYNGCGLIVQSGPVTGVTCKGRTDGSVTVTASGGTEPYQYMWSNSQTSAALASLAAGIYTVSVTDANSCESSIQVQISEPPAFVTDSTRVKQISCFGGNNGIGGIFVSGGTSPYTYQWNTGQTTNLITTLGVGTYTVTATDAKGCTVVSTASIASPPDLSLAFSGVVQERCPGACAGEATVSASGGVFPYSVAWNDPGIATGTTTAVNLCPGTYTVTATDANGCTETGSLVINPVAPLVSSFVSTSPACAGIQNGNAAISVSGGTGPYRYVWENGATTSSVNNLACGSHSVTVIDFNNCTAAWSVQLDCPPAILFATPSTSAAPCFGQPGGTASIQPSGGQAPYSYQWSNGQTTQSATGLTAGTYILTVTDQNGCTASAQAQVGQPQAITTTVSSAPATCFGSANGQTSVSATGGTAPYSYKWSQGSTTQTISGLAAGVYTVTVTDANNCVATTTSVVSQPVQSVQVQVNQVQAACFGEANGIASATASGGTGSYQFAWSNGQTGSNAGSFAAGTWSITATDAAGCTGTASFQITELPRVQVNVSYIIPVCAGVPNGIAEVNQISGGLGMGNTGSYHYYWGVPGAADEPAILMLPGNASYTLTVSDFQGCTGTFTFFVGEPPAMTIGATGKPASCADGTDGSAETGQITNANGLVSFEWSNGATTASIQQLSPGFYGVTATDAKGCTADAAVTVGSPPALQVSLRPEALTCHGNNDASLESVVSGGTPAYSYSWSNGATSENLNNITAGTYSVTVKDMNGCTITTARTIEELPAPQLSVTGTDPVCHGDKNGRFALSVQGGTAPWVFSINNGPFTPGGNFLALGAGTYQFNAMDANGCTVSGSGSLSQPQPLQVILPADTTLTLGDSLYVAAIVSGATGLPAYTWSSLWNDRYACTDSMLCDELLIHPTINNRFTVTVTDANRCSASQSVRISIVTPGGVYVPTGFSPNDDQVNDLLVVHGTGSQLEEIVTFSVYDRWGELVYEDQHFPVNETTRGWDGSFRGKPCNPGVFVWVLEALYRDGRKELLRGNVVLVR